MLVLHSALVHNMIHAGALSGYPERLQKQTGPTNRAPGWARNSKKKLILSLTDKMSFAILVRYGAIAQLIRALPWHGRGRGFESL